MGMRSVSACVSDGLSQCVSVIVSVTLTMDFVC